MGKATDTALGELHGAIARGLTEVVSEGAVIGLAEDGQPIRATAGAAYFAAGIAFLKNNNITADPATNAAVAGLTAALAAKRKEGKGNLSAQAIREAAEDFDRHLGGMMTQ